MERIGRFIYSTTAGHDNYIIPYHRQVLSELVKYYTSEFRVQRHANHTQPNKDNISLRLLDWFVTNYSKKNQTCWSLRGPHGTLTLIQVHEMYITELANWKRILFDPFQRRNRILYNCPLTNDLLTTTVAQLNFMKFVNELGIYDYVRDNRKVIEADMTASSRNNKKKHKRMALSRAPMSVICIKQVTSMLT